MAANKTKPKGNRPDKFMRDALIVALHREAKDGNTRKLALVADALVKRAMDGDVPAIKEIFDRVDGKSIQPIAGDSEGGPVKMEVAWAKS